MQTVGPQLLDFIPWESPIQEDVSLVIAARLFFSIDDCRRCMDVMRTLTAKYAEGYDGWARQRGEEPVVK